MRFMIAAHNDGNKPAAVEMTNEIFDSYMKFNEELHKAGVLVAAEGLNPAGIRARVEVKGGKRVVVDGPYAETKELVGGFYVIEVKSKEEALAWAQRCPMGLGTDNVLDIHQLTGADDLPAEIVERVRKVAPTWSKTFEKKP
ncbi:MAG: dehydrogenase [Myxococcaceae bacterium]|nr:dehydrogenase [Myxococcaceae bacterium]